VGALLPKLPQLLGEDRHDLQGIAHDPVIRHLEDGRLGSVLIATMHFEVRIPARCWIAPLIATAM